ncbi:DNA repair protein RadC [Paenibacillus alginolyticus]|uniref:RadC family protein n=1 Tax=Paenibacillus alginolyticus TaxID=59839 RepID=UPI0004058C10|nr:DNA repair protein RadC [Paenibacillus alginolyticus]MCY9665132.1 DNA repair protein RadC [Paenibacillus alginolyticus]
MQKHQNPELKSLLTQSLCEKQGSYLIEEIFHRFPIASELIEVTEQELTKIKGIGMGKARQITAMLKLAKAISVPNHNPYIIKSPKDVYELLAPDLKHLQKEHFVCLLLNTKNHLIFKEVTSIGSLNSAIVHPREVFRSAIKRSSASLICAHNHPSGCTLPSPEDINLTRRLVEAGEKFS